MDQRLSVAVSPAFRILIFGKVTTILEKQLKTERFREPFANRLS